MLVTMAIVAVMSVIIGSALLPYLPRANLKRACRTIVSLGQMARTEAVKRNCRVAVVFSTTAGTASVYTGNGDGSWTSEGDNTLFQRFSLGEAGSGVVFGHGSASTTIASGTWSSNLPTGNKFEFSGRGVLKSNSEVDADNTLYLQNNVGSSMAITVHASGGITTLEWSGSAWQ